MKLPFFLLFALSQLNTVIAQKQPKLLKAKGNTNCVYKEKYSAKQRSQFYPFNVADTIKLVSFRYTKGNYPFRNGIVIADSLIDVKVLTLHEINQLTDIIYNNFYKKAPNYGTVNQCWIPHNAILFFDKLGKLKEYISICFHCSEYRESSDKIRVGDDCDQKMDKLRSFFISAGVQFGTDPEIEYGGGKEEDIVLPPKN